MEVTCLEPPGGQSHTPSVPVTQVRVRATGVQGPSWGSRLCPPHTPVLSTHSIWEGRPEQCVYSILYSELTGDEMMAGI